MDSGSMHLPSSSSRAFLSFYSCFLYLPFSWFTLSYWWSTRSCSFLIGVWKVNVLRSFLYRNIFILVSCFISILAKYRILNWKSFWILLNNFEGIIQLLFSFQLLLWSLTPFWFLILYISCFTYSFVFVFGSLWGTLFGASVLKFCSDMPELEVCFHPHFWILNRPFQSENSFFSVMGKFLELILWWFLFLFFYVLYGTPIILIFFSLLDLSSKFIPFSPIVYIFAFLLCFLKKFWMLFYNLWIFYFSYHVSNSKDLFNFLLLLFNGIPYNILRCLEILDCLLIFK